MRSFDAEILEAKYQQAYGGRAVLVELYEQLAIASSLGKLDTTKICESGLFDLLDNLWDETGAKYTAAAWLQSHYYTKTPFDAPEPVQVLWEAVLA